MNLFADFELSLHQRSGSAYTIEGRLSLPGDDADQRFGLDAPLIFEYDPLDFEGLVDLPDEYGKALTEKLFADDGTKTMWASVTSAAAAAGATLRMRLLIGPSAAELNGVYWETLRNPKDNSPLFTGENLLFSRYLSSSDMRPVNLRPKQALKALAVSANPSDLANYKLAPVDVAGELDRARHALKDIPLEVYPSAPGEFATLEKIMEKLRDGVDIFYLAAHGTLANGEPFVWLENEEGKTDKLSASQLAVRIRELANQPRLIVLASCQSAGKGNGQTLQALGPRLAQAGVPAVLAMQGNISMNSEQKFTPVFFTELMRDGQIDRALAVARGVIRDEHDFWMPVLFTRLQSGKIWYVPGQNESGQEFEKWPVIFSSLQAEQCTPILGPGLYEPLIGSWREMAASLANRYGFPLADFYRDMMPQVTQFIVTHFDLNTLFTSVDGMMRSALQQRFGAALPEGLKKPNANLLQLFSEAGKIYRKENAEEQHKVLAGLPIRIFISTNYDDLMFDALKEAGKDPQRVICPWSDRFYADSIYDSDPGYLPSVEKPLVYHLFGHLSVPDSMVLTEDDYYEFLIGFTANKKRTPPVIPPAILRALTDSALLVLGFSLDDWAFRAFFRTVMVQPGGSRRARYSHVGVQVEPDELHNLNPKKAHKYLEKYFGASSIELYWGKSQDFLRQLAEKRAAA